VEIRRKEFRNAFRGYDATEVDDFLDTVADEFERSYSESQRLAEEVSNLEGRLAQFQELEDSIHSALVHAEEAARDLRRNANKEAELIVREAKERAHRILADSSSRVERVQESYEVLNKAKQEFANDFRQLLKGYLAVMDNADVASAKEIEAALRERLDLESVGAAREAAETRRMEAGRTEQTAGDQATSEEPVIEPAASERVTGGADDETRHIEVPATPAGGDRTAEQIETTATTSPVAGPPEGERREREPEVEEPEVNPSSAESPEEHEDATNEAAKPETPGAAEEVGREEAMPSEEGRYDEFFDRGRESSGEEPEREERKLFRASRFLRRQRG
jgi:cell division initiation protein